MSSNGIKLLRGIALGAALALLIVSIIYVSIPLMARDIQYLLEH